MQLITTSCHVQGPLLPTLIDEAKQFDTMRHVFAGAGACGGMCTAHTMPVNMDTVHAANHHLLSCAGSYAADLIDKAKQSDTLRHVFAGAGTCGGVCTAHAMTVNLGATMHLLTVSGHVQGPMLPT